MLELFRLDIGSVARPPGLEPGTSGLGTTKSGCLSQLDSILVLGLSVGFVQVQSNQASPSHHSDTESMKVLEYREEDYRPLEDLLEKARKGWERGKKQ